MRFFKGPGNKNIIMSIVALILLMILVVGMSYSWIEEVSNVELKNNNPDAQSTPLHISNEELKSDITISQTNYAIDLSSYFYRYSARNSDFRDGNVHLSGCYSDGEDFKFPADDSTANSRKYRDGTKDDANTNYLSVTFRVNSPNVATSYWFEKKNGSAPYFTTRTYTGATDTNGGPDSATAPPVNNEDPNLQYLRTSVTVNGATTVYAFNSNGSYKINAYTSCETKDRRPVDNYTYYPETYATDYKDTSVNNGVRPLGYYKASANTTNKPNQGAGNNLDGNTVFTVPKDTPTTVTVKLWLEADAPVNTIDLSDINLQLSSSWKYNRRIYVRDMTVDEYDKGLNNGAGGATGSNWLKNADAHIYWAIYDTSASGNIRRWEITKVSSKDSTNHTDEYYYVDIPEVYTGYEAVLYRCSGDGWNHGTNTDNTLGVNVSYWDCWKTAFPATYHSEVFSVYSHEYANWDTVNAKDVYFVDSAKLINQYDNSNLPDDSKLKVYPKVYLWDSEKIYDSDDVNGKVVKNAAWPGEKMTRLNDTAGNMNLPLMKVFFQASNFDRAVFNDGRGDSTDRTALQSQDVWLLSKNAQGTITQTWEGKYFDMSTLTWFDDANSLPTYTSTVLVNNFNTNNEDEGGDGKWAHIRMVYGNGAPDTNNHYFMCRAYVKDPGDYQLMVYDGNADKHYGKPDGWGNWASNYGETMRDINDHQYTEGYVVNISISAQDITDSENGVFRFYYDTNTHYFIWYKGE